VVIMTAPPDHVYRANARALQAGSTEVHCPLFCNLLGCSPDPT
jgi:hypothetical protein